MKKIVHTFQKMLYASAGFAIRNLHLYRAFRFKDDHRETFPARLVYLCGKEGIRYLNASLTSIYFFWDKLPEVIVISDGSPLKGLIKWPRKLEVISWSDALPYFAEKGNTDICTFATNTIYGKKIISLLHLSQQFPVLYSDTDVLWYASPEELPVNEGGPYLKMSRDVERGYYSRSLIDSLQEQPCLDTPPFNAGVMYLHGDLSGYPRWKELFRHLASDSSDESANFGEQTAFAILNNHFNAASYWEPNEILIRIDDAYDLKYTLKDSPGIIARHYVHTRPTAFWRDFTFICAKKLMPSSLQTTTANS